jgi:hypothetical protein
MFINRFAFKMYNDVRRPLQQLGSRRLFSCQNSCKHDIENMNAQIKIINDKLSSVLILQSFTYLLSFANIIL